MKDWLLARLREPSTHAALAGLYAAAGFGIDAGAVSEILIGLAAVLGVVGVGMRKKGRSERPCFHQHRPGFP